ncbi:MAG TPA: PAS domain-containing protein, partial [bacterium]|nr:PAS domain-containing protein [bacterium]
MTPDPRTGKLIFSQVQNLLKLLQSGKDFSPEMLVLKSILEETREGVLIAGGDGRFLYMNAVMRRLHGNHELSDLDPARWAETYGLYKADGSSLYDPQDLPLARALRGETVEDQRLFVRNEWTPGTLLSARGGPLRDEKGEVKGGLVFLNDITREDAERVRAQRLADLVDFSPISIIETTSEARIVSWNAGAERVYGYKAEEIIGKFYSRLVPLDKLPEVQKQVLRLLKGELVLEHETVRVRKDGES